MDADKDNHAAAIFIPAEGPPAPRSTAPERSPGARSATAEGSPATRSTAAGGSATATVSGPAGTRPTRRQVLRGAGTGLGAAALAPVLGRSGSTAAASTRPAALAAGNRAVDFGQGWKFALVKP